MVKTFYPIESFGASDIGLVRKQNQDVWSAHPEEGIYLIADGMGGHRAGEVAAEMAVNRFFEVALEDLDCAEVMAEVNRTINEAGNSNPAWKGMGTTLTALVFKDREVIVAHVGDSRAYRLRRRQLTQLTEDHTVYNKVKSAESAMMKHVLTRAVGTQPQVKPQIQNFEVEPHDCYFLCTDGLANYISDDKLASLLAEEGEMEVKCAELIEMAKAKGGSDNITLVILEVGG
ncbi:MAG: serine/threonine-protein phosphatase [Chlamydiales bacterium]|nr:serine/threonine-protein phosphatase [Chlamydiales bacterium]